MLSFYDQEVNKKVDTEEEIDEFFIRRFILILIKLLF